MLPYKRYDTTLANVTSVLDQHGVATLPNILTHEECVTLRKALFAELSHVTKGRFRIDDPATWRHYYDLMPLHSMLTQHWGLGQSQPVWDIRQHPRVGEVFSHLWQTPLEEMLVSFDGISIHMPPETTKRGWYTGNKWLHTDQSSHKKKGKHCIQGLINLYPVNPGDATLTVLEGSHALHEEFFEASGTDVKDDWHVLKTPAELEFFAANDCKQYCVQADEGSMVLWDSRTMHSGIEPQFLSPIPHGRLCVHAPPPHGPPQRRPQKTKSLP